MSRAGGLFILCIFGLFKGSFTAPSEEPVFGNSTLEELEREISHLTMQVNGLTKTVETLEDKMSTNIADQYADKTIQSILANNQNEATKFWLEMLNHAKQVRPDELLSQIVHQAYSGTRTNFYKVLEFVLKNNITAAFPLLYSELEYHDHIFGGQEVFVLAYYLKATCGANTRLYQSLSPVVRDVISGPVIIQNVDNGGFIIASVHQPCKDKTECYGNPKTEAFLHRIYTHGESPPTEVVENPRSHWQFLPPITMDMKNGFNGTRMSWGFHIKNEADQRFLIAKMRMTAFFLRNNTIFDSYYIKDMQCQFVPTLMDVEGEGHLMMIGLREKHVHKMEYVFGSKFYKSDIKTALATRNHYDMQGKLWDIIPVSGMEVRDESDENTVDVETDIVSDSKCQF